MEKNKSFLKQTLRPILIVAGLSFVIFVAFFVHAYRQIQSGELVKFQGHYYSQENLRKILPPQYAPLKEPKNTTEEVYTKFREALLSGNIDEALGYIRKRDREEYRIDFNDPEVLKLYIDIPPFSELTIYDDMENFQRGYHYYKKNDNEPFSINFKLNQITALWEIDSI